MQHVGKMETLCVASATTPPYSISFQSLLLYDGKKILDKVLSYVTYA